MKAAGRSLCRLSLEELHLDHTISLASLKTLAQSISKHPNPDFASRLRYLDILHLCNVTLLILFQCMQSLWNGHLTLNQYTCKHSACTQPTYWNQSQVIIWSCFVSMSCGGCFQGLQQRRLKDQWGWLQRVVLNWLCTHTGNIAWRGACEWIKCNLSELDACVFLRGCSRFFLCYRLRAIMARSFYKAAWQSGIVPEMQSSMQTVDFWDLACLQKSVGERSIWKNRWLSLLCATIQKTVACASIGCRVEGSLILVSLDNDIHIDLIASQS